MGAVRYRHLTESDSSLLSEGIRRVYGSTYPVPEFYDTAWIARNIASGCLHTIVALDETGEVVGCMSTVLENPGDYTADGSALMVAPEYRGQGLVAQLGNHSVETYQALGLGGLHLYALALQDRVQSQSGKAGAGVTGCLPAWFSRAARVAGYDYPDVRIGAVPLYMPLAELPARVSYLPRCYGKTLEHLCTEMKLPRQFVEARTGIPLPSRTIFNEEHRPANQQLRVVISRCGDNLPQLLEGFREVCCDKAYEVIYLDLPLTDPGIGNAVEYARQAGLFFGALMIERASGDRLRLQAYIGNSAAPDRMVLATEQAGSLRDYVLEDRASLSTSFFGS